MVDQLIFRVAFMSPQTALPQYIQITEQLIREMMSGHLMPGDRLPPERVMAADLGIAVGTLRKSLAELTARGLLERRQGSGNYVRQGNLRDAVYSFFRLELPEGGGLPTAQVLDVELMEKPRDLPKFGSGSDAHRIQRLRFLNGRPAALEQIWLDAKFAERITVTDLSDSLYQFYKKNLGLWIARVEDVVSFAEMPDWTPKALSAGQTCGYVERKSWSQDGMLAEVSRTWFDVNNARYVARMR